ncbi:signal peptidase I [Leifsonia xyli subsp. xyli str. CTCB07]|uniref:Signal peptidase I n=1 Tax=Leifsonia xyli subsp. xyli (strain CTCB07) TaxID=281090 RepID=Q6ACN9_LEIXX|nr:signal peptidase I [Leifsonia xyli subsp. xyli str. CTCB07]
MVARVITANVCRVTVWYLVGLLVWVIAPLAIGWHTTTVMSGSMTPAIAAGDLVVVRPVPADQLRAGQVIQFDDPDHPGQLRLHRLVKIKGDTLTTRGDANAQSDSSPVAANTVHGIGVLRVSWIGIPVKAFAEHNYLFFVVLAVGAVLLVVGTRLDHAYDWIPVEDEPGEETTHETGAHRTDDGRFDGFLDLVGSGHSGRSASPSPLISAFSSSSVSTTCIPFLPNRFSDFRCSAGPVQLR